MYEDKNNEFYLNRLSDNNFEETYNNASFTNLPIRPDIIIGRILATKKDVGSVNVSVNSELMRGATLPGPVEFQNSQGEKFFYIDSKGAGSYVLSGKSFFPFDIDEKWHRLEKRIEGVAFLSGELRDTYNTEKLVNLGVRVPQFISVFALSSEVFPAHVQEKLTELHEKACIVFRGFKNPYRIGGLQDLLPSEALLNALPQEKVLAIRNKASETVQSTVKGLKMEGVWRDYGGNENEDYLLNFARLLGQNVGKMQKGRYIHRSPGTIGGMVHFSNITLAAEVVDHDTGTFLKDELSDQNKALFVNQYLLALRNLSVLSNSLEVFNQEDWSDPFLSRVSSEFRDTFLNQVDEKDQKWFKQILLDGLTQPNNENWVWYMHPDTQKQGYPPTFRNRREFMVNFIGHIFLHEEEKFYTDSK
jgi:hypothetical protein